jgi:hypothetical protein
VRLVACRDLGEIHEGQVGAYQTPSFSHIVGRPKHVTKALQAGVAIICKQGGGGAALPLEIRFLLSGALN